MGGRGVRMSSTQTMRNEIAQRAGGGGGEASQQNQPNIAGGGGADDRSEFTSSNGTRVLAGGASDREIQAVLGDKYTREVVANILGHGKGGTLSIAINPYGQVFGTYRNSTYYSDLGLSRNPDGSVNYIGGTLFPRTSGEEGIRAVQGAGIRALQRTLSYAVRNNLVQTLTIPAAIGSAGDQRALGSSLWARLGADARLDAYERARLGANTSLPSSVRNATTISGLMQDRAGRQWWEENRRTFEGRIDFRVREGDSFNIWSRFLRG